MGFAVRAFFHLPPQKRRRFLSGPAASVFVFLIAACFCSPSQAGILVGDWKNFGDGLLTIDTTQGLEFLDLTESLNRSYNDVSGQFGAGGDFEGFRYATEQEAVNLINEIGWSGTPAFVAGGFSLQAGANTAEAAAIQQLIGAVAGGPLNLRSFGFTSTVVSGRQRVLQVFRSLYSGPSGGAAGGRGPRDFASASLAVPPGGHARILGSFLVRSSGSASPPPGGGNPGGGMVPEPSSFAMFALAGLGLVGARRRKN